AVVATSGGHRRVPVDGDGQDEAAVVIGVLADQVDPSGRRPHLRRIMTGPAPKLVVHPPDCRDGQLRVSQASERWQTAAAGGQQGGTECGEDHDCAYWS